MIRRIVVLIIVLLALAASGIGSSDEKGCYLLIYKEQVYTVPVGSSMYHIERNVHKYFPTIESALGWMNESQRVSKAMFVSLNYVVAIPVEQEIDSVPVRMDVRKWKVKL